MLASRPPSVIATAARAAAAAAAAAASAGRPARAATTRRPRASADDGSSAASSALLLATATPDEWEARRKRRLVQDLRDALAAAHRRAASNRRPLSAAQQQQRLNSNHPTTQQLPSLADATEERLSQGLAALEGLLPGWRLDLDAAGVPAASVAALALDPSEAAARVLALKDAWPRADLGAVVQRKPAVLLEDPQTIRANAAQIRQLLRTARDADALVTSVPELLSPRQCLAILITVNKWYFSRRDPVAVLESDPGLIERASAADMPLEPVFTDSQGKLTGPSLDYWNKRTEWQAYIDTNVYKQPRGKGDVFPSERIVGGDAGGKDAGGDEFFVGQGF
jgi:hypothetical protein